MRTAEEVREELGRLEGVRNEISVKLMETDPEWRDINAQIVRMNWMLEGGVETPEKKERTPRKTTGRRGRRARGNDAA